MDGKPKKGGSRPRIHTVDGRPMTVDAIAGMIGFQRRQLIQLRCRMGGVSYQLIVNMWREGRLLTKGDRSIRHLVHGRWMTVKQASLELNCKPHSIENWRSRNRDKDGNKPTVEEAYDHLMNAPKRGSGSVARKHRVNGKHLTVREAAEKYGTTENALRQTMHRHGCTLDAAVKRLENRRVRKAQRDIMDILKGGT